MKISKQQLIQAGLAATLLTQLPAIEPPADNATPPPLAAAPADNAPPLAAAPAAQATPYLGIGTTQVPEVLASHIGLKADEGIIIRAIDPNGPGANAGLSEHDVITRIAGQAVGSHADLFKQIQSHKAGDAVALDLIHQGKPVQKTITLAARPDGGGVAAAPQALDNLMLDGMPQEQAKHIRDAIARQLRAMQDGAANPDGHADDDMAKMVEAMKDAQKRMADAMRNGLHMQDDGVSRQNGATFRMQDENGSIEIKSADGGKEATIRDKDNKITWSGPWDTAQDKAAAPPDVRARIDKLNIDSTLNGNGLRLRLGGKVLIEPEPVAPEAAPNE
jgi:hypothetical protein